MNSEIYKKKNCNMISLLKKKLRTVPTLRKKKNQGLDIKYKEKSVTQEQNRKLKERKNDLNRDKSKHQMRRKSNEALLLTSQKCN